MVTPPEKWFASITESYRRTERHLGTTSPSCNLRKLRAHRIKGDEVEQALSSDPILIYEQDAGEEPRYVYYGESDSGRMLAVVLIEHDDRIRVYYGLRFGYGAEARLTSPGVYEESKP